MTLKTYHHLPAHQARVHPQQQKIISCPQEEQLKVKTPPAGLSDGMMGRDRDGEHNPLERPQVSEDKETVVTDGEASEVAARHFELVMFR